jgi:hypothetical protein
MRDMNEFSNNPSTRKHRSLDRLKRKKNYIGHSNKNYIKANISHNDVFETEEEQLSDPSDKEQKGRRKKKIFTLGQFSQLMKYSKIYSDDFNS